MPHEDRNQDRNEDDDNDTYGSRAASTTIVDYNGSISHTSVLLSSLYVGPVIPRVQASISGEASAMWVVSGLVLSIVLALVAWTRSRASNRTYYEGEVYGMDAAGHRNYALAFAVAAAFFSAELAWPGEFAKLVGGVNLRTLMVLSAVVLMAILYGSTFVRGASGEDE